MSRIQRVTTYRYNYQGLFSAMTILCQTISLVMMSGIALSAVSNKFTNTSSVALVALTITFSLRIADLVTSIVSDLAKL